MKKILIITSDKFPKGNAGATRQEVLAKLFARNSNFVDVIGMGETTNFKFINLNEKIRYVSMRGDKNCIFKRIYDRLLFSRRLIKQMKKNEKYDVVLIESIPLRAIKYVKQYKKLTGCILIHDSVEWYSASEFKFGKYSLAYIIKDVMNRKSIDQNFNVIAISKYLENYFADKGCKVVRIPFIHDVIGTKFNKALDDNIITFIYAGMMGRKDYIDNFIKAIYSMDKSSLNRIRVEFFGFDKKYLLKVSNIKEDILNTLELDNVITFHGRVSRDIVEENLKKANFTVLFRNSEERYAKAGFPTKVVESLMYGTPVFCNISSDLDLYLEDSYNSVIAKTDQINDIIKGLNEILSYSPEQIKQISINSRQTALKYFDFRLYYEEIEKISEVL